MINIGDEGSLTAEARRAMKEEKGELNIVYNELYELKGILQMINRIVHYYKKGTREDLIPAINGVINE